MGIGNSTLNGRPPQAWWDAWPVHTSGNEQQRARLVDEFEDVAPAQEEPVPPVTVAQVHAFEAERERQWRAPDPAGLPARWPATAFQLWADITQTVQQVRQAPAPNRHVRHARHRHLSGRVEVWQTSRHAEHWQSSGHAAVGTGDHAKRGQSAAPTLSQSFPAGGDMIRSQLDQLDPSLLADYLTTQGFAEPGEPSGCVQNATVLMALHRHLAPAREFVGDPAALERLDPDACANLMRYVARERGFYGARDGEQSAPEFQRQLLIRLVSLWATGRAPAGGTSTAAPGLPAVTAQETMAWIKAREISRLQASGLTADAAEWVAGLLWADTEPTVVRADTPGALRYGRLEWADLQTGIDLAGAAGLDHWSMTYAELVALAQVGDMTLRLHPDDASGLLALQVRTALVVAGMTLKLKVPHAREDIERAMMFLNELRSARWELLQQRQQALEALHAPLPMRSLNGARILREHGIDPEQHIMVRRSGLEVGGKYYAHPTWTRLSQYLGGDRSGSLVVDGGRDERILPDLDPLFNQAFAQYKETARQAIELLYGEAVAALPEEDRTFWERGNAQILVPEVRAGRYLPVKPSSPRDILAERPFLENSSPQTKPFTAIVALTHDGQTRHYLAAMASAEGRLIRFLARDFPHDAAHSPDNASILDGALFPYIDDLVTQGDAVKAAEQRRWKLAPGGVASGWAVSVLAEYFVEAIEKLRDHAYQSTQKQQFEQAVRDGLMSMIPFYDCVNEVKGGTAGGAIFSCALDVVSLIPVVGTTLKVATGAGKLTIQVSTSVLKQLAQTSVKGRLSQQALRTAVAEIARAAPLAASFARSSSRALAWEAAQLFDPGVQLFHSAGKGLQALLSTLRQEPALQALANRISATLKQKPFHFDAQAGVWHMRNSAVTPRAGRRFEQIGDGRELEVIDLGEVSRVPVVRVADHADARFILVEPLQGRPYGPQWVPTADGFAALGDYRVRLESPVPDPDPEAEGIVHVGQRNYIQVEGEYYPVSHDEASQTWRIHRENDPDGAPIPVRYDADRRRWEVLGDDAASGAVAARRPSLGDLPNEMQSEIARHLPDADTGRMSQVSHHWDELLVQDRRAGQLAEQARSVGGLAQMRRLLGGEGVAGIQDLRMSLRDRPLLELTQRIDELPGLERPAAFHFLYEAISALPSQQRGMLLAALANRLGDLVAVYRQTRHRRIFDETLRLEARHRAGPLAALAGQVGQLDMQARSDTFDDLIRATLLLDARHRAVPLAALAAAIPHLPERARPDRFDLVFAEVGTLPMGERAGPLAVLAEQIGLFDEIGRQSAFNRILERIDALPTQHRAEPLVSLSGQIEALNDIGRQPAFNHILERIDALPTQHRAEPLASLSGQIEALNEIDRQSAFNRMLERIEGLPAEYGAVPLAALINQVPTLPGDGWLAPFDGILRAAILLDAGVHGEPLTRVAELIERLPPERRLAAVHGLLHAVETLDPERRAGQYTQLAWRIIELPEHQRLVGYDVVFGATLRLPAERRAVPLAELADHIFWMPDQRQPGEFNRILGQIDALPAEHRDLLLKALIKQVRSLPRERRPEVFEGLLGAAVGLDAGEPLMRLARIIRQFPRSRQMAAFDRLIDATAALDASVRGKQLMRLARLGQRLPEDRLAAFRSLMRAVDEFDVERRSEQYVQLARLLDQLPEHQRMDLFDAVFTAAVALPEEHRIVPLEALTAQVHVLPGNRRLDAIRRVGPEMSALSQPTWDAALSTLVWQFEFLPERRLDMFTALTRASALTTPENRAGLLWRLTNRIGSVEPAADRGRAWRSVLRETETLAPEARAMAHATLASRIDAIPSGHDRLDAFNDLLAAIGRLPAQQRDAALMTAADNIRLLPEGDRPAAYDRIEDSRAADPAG